MSADRSAFDFEKTPEAESNRRVLPDPDECEHCQHVHKQPDDLTRKCWAWIVRRVGKLSVQKRIGHCRCRGEPEEPEPTTKPCEDCEAPVPRRLGKMGGQGPRVCDPCRDVREQARKERQRAVYLKKRRDVDPKCRECGVPVQRRRGRNAGGSPLYCAPCRKERDRDAVRRYRARQRGMSR